MKNIANLFKELLKIIKRIIGYHDFPTEYEHFKFISKHIDFLSIVEINQEFFGFLYQKTKEEEKNATQIDVLLPKGNDVINLKKYYKLALEPVDNDDYFTIQDGELLAVYTVSVDNGKIYQYIRRYYQNYDIKMGNFHEILEIPILNYKRKIIYKDLYFQDCSSSYNIKKTEKIFYKDI